MLQPEVLLGLDLGASKVAAVVALQDDAGVLKVTGAGLANPQGGIKMGEIVDINLTTAAILTAVQEAMRMAGQTRLDGIMVSVDGIQFKGENLRDTVTISNPDRVITIHDRNRVLDQATNSCKLAKEETVLHKSPQAFHIKGQRDIKNPVNMLGDTLEAEVRIIVAPGPVLENINRALHMSGLGGAKLCYSPLASAKAVLSREDAENGAVVVDIGEQLTHIGVFMRGAIFHSAVIPLGGTHFTRDLEITKHLGGIPVAERVKRYHGTVLPNHVPPEEMIELEDEGKQVSKREIAEVLHARGVELLNMVLSEIGKIGFSHDIHGGVHLIGGGALLLYLPNLAQSILGRPRVVMGKTFGILGFPQVVDNPFYANALGAVKMLCEDLDDFAAKPSRDNSVISNSWKKLKNLF